MKKTLTLLSLFCTTLYADFKPHPFETESLNFTISVSKKYNDFNYILGATVQDMRAGIKYLTLLKPYKTNSVIHREYMITVTLTGASAVDAIDNIENDQLKEKFINLCKIYFKEVDTFIKNKKIDPKGNEYKTYSKSRLKLIEIIKSRTNGSN